MPDFQGRPDGKSLSLKAAYAFLRSQNYPDQDLFIFPQGKFGEFKGEILGQKPHPGELVEKGDRITLIASVPGICEIMPDLFTDHRDDFFDEEFNNRGGAKRLFAIFDSLMIKMQCKLDWIRDIYGGIYESEEIINYFSLLLNLPERNLKIIAPEILGYVLPALYGHLGTEEALRIYIETVMRIKTRIRMQGYQIYDIPEETLNSLGAKGRLGNNLYMGRKFKGSGINVEIDLLLDSPEMIESIIPGSKGNYLLEKILEYSLPQMAEGYKLNFIPDPEKIKFNSGTSHLGYGTVLGK
jgi:hypothetical protein